MELIKKNLHMNKVKANMSTQITLEDDFIVSDVKSDVDEIITNSGKIVIENIRVSNQKVNLKGKLLFALLYGSMDDNRLLHNMTGELPIEELINVEGVMETDSVSLKCDIEDLTIGIINSRKISVRAIISIKCVVEDLYDIEPVVDIVSEEKLDCLKKELEVSQLAVMKKDIFRIKDEIDIPSNKQNMAQILWDNIDVRSINTKLADGRIDVNGELQMFVLYEAEEENAPVQWIESTMPFSGIIDMPECDENMIADIGTSVANATVGIKPDYDGEQRVIEYEMVLDLNIKIFKEDSVIVVSDVNSVACQLNPKFITAKLNSLLMKNVSKCKVSDKVRLDSEKGNIMQLCCSNGRVKVEEIVPADNTVQVRGVVGIDMMYISSDDRLPICMQTENIPFEQNVEVTGVNNDSIVTIRPSLEQLNANMAGNNEIEIKGYVSLDCLVFDTFTEDIIDSIERSEFNMEEIRKAPCIVGYKVKKGDTLWKIAKKYYTSVECLKMINELKGDELMEGQMLLVVKEAV